MQVELNTIIKLNNDEKYIVLNELDYNEKKYFLTMGVVDDNEIDSTRVVIIEEGHDNEGYFVEKVIDSDLLLTLTKLFKEQL